MAKYKVGDKVRIVDHRTDHMNNFGGMDKWLGKVMTIRDLSSPGYWMREDYGENYGYGWLWDKVSKPKVSKPFVNEAGIVQVLTPSEVLPYKEKSK